MADSAMGGNRPFTILEVNDGHALTLPGFQAPQTRAEIYELQIRDFASPHDLLDYLDECVPLADRVRSKFETYRDDAEAAIEALEEGSDEAAIVAAALRSQLAKFPEDTDEAARLWLSGMSEEDFVPLQLSVEKWLAAGPEWDYEEDYFPNPVSGRAAALRLLESENGDLLDALGIVLVYGDRPGSSYYAAELETPIDDANRIAAEIGSDYRFILEGEYQPHKGWEGP